MQAVLKFQKNEFLNKYSLLTYVLLAGSILFLLNPGLYWDDYVWAFKSREEALAIGKELGIWWGGYATNFINTRENPALVMRLVAWIGWIVASFFFAMTLSTKKILSKEDAFWIFLLCSATYLASIRYFISASFYNLYIASFWIGIFILLRYKTSIKNQIFATPFIFFSFYLNSLIAIYGLIIFIFFVDGCSQKHHFRALIIKIRKSLVDDFFKLNIGTFKGFLENIGICLKNLLKIPEKLIDINYSLLIKILKSEVLNFINKNYIILLIPLIFIIVKKISIENSPTYESYNEIDIKVLLSSIFISIKMIPELLFEYIIFASRSAKSIFIIINFIIIFTLMCRVQVLNSPESKIRSFGIPIIFGIILLSTSIYPYLVVHKIPKISDYYESRHLLPAILAMSLFFIGLVNALSSKALIKNEKLRNLLKKVLLSYLLAINISAGQAMGIKLWQDFELQVGIEGYLKENITEFKSINTFIFNDSTFDSRIGNRYIWNYEYTGALIRVFGGKDRLGISLNEYRGWEKNVILLNSDFYRKRYNLDNYDFNGPHALIYIFNKKLKTPKLNTLKFAYEYLLGGLYEKTINEKYLFEHKYEYIEATKIIPVLLEARDALIAYKLKYGFYPSDFKASPGVPLSGSSTPPDSYVNHIPGLFPKFMDAPAGFKLLEDSSGDAIEGRPFYTYQSNGLDYKLTYHNALDLSYAKQAYPGFFDSKANVYGVWSNGASSW